MITFTHYSSASFVSPCLNGIDPVMIIFVNMAPVHVSWATAISPSIMYLFNSYTALLAVCTPVPTL